MQFASKWWVGGGWIRVGDSVCMCMCNVGWEEGIVQQGES